MQYVEFGHDGLKVSRFGLGCMRFPSLPNTGDKKIIDEDKAIEIIRYAIDNGVNYIDTAYIYEGSEQVVGKALRDGYRERVILATKQPTVLLRKLEADAQRPFFEEQLERLQTDHFDVYFLHNLGPKSWDCVQRVQGLDFITSLKQEGLIKYAAASVHSDFSHLKKVADAYPWDLMMLQYNYYDRFNQAGEQGAQYVHQKGIPLVTMESNRGGMLAENVPQQVREQFTWQPDMPDYERSMLWLIHQQAPTVILSGVSSLEQLKQNLALFDRYQPNCLTTEQFDAYELARAAWNRIVKVGCTDCKYCMPCPKGVNIPGIFDAYNMLARATRKEQAQPWIYTQLFRDTGTDASNCIACKLCEGKCPQVIPIAEKLKEAHAVFTAK